MQEFFETLFAGYGFSEAQIEKMGTEFAAVVVATLLGATKEKMSEEDVKKVQKLFEDEKPAEVLEMMRAKYSPEEWNALIAEHVTPLFQSYCREVMGVEI